MAVSNDGGKTFVKQPGTVFAGNSKFVQFAVATGGPQDDYLYLLSTPSGRYAAAFLTRVRKTDLLKTCAMHHCPPFVNCCVSGARTRRLSALTRKGSRSGHLRSTQLSLSSLLQLVRRSQSERAIGS